MSGLAELYTRTVELFFARRRWKLIGQQVEAARNFEKILKEMRPEDRLEVLQASQGAWGLVRQLHGADLQQVKTVERRHPTLLYALFKIQDKRFKAGRDNEAFAFYLWIVSVRSVRADEIQQIAQRCWTLLLEEADRLGDPDPEKEQSGLYRLPFGLGLPDEKRRKDDVEIRAATT